MSEQSKNHVDNKATNANEFSDDEEPIGLNVLGAAVAVAAPPSILMSTSELMHKEDEAADYRSALPPMSHTSAYMSQSDEEIHFRDLPMNATLPAGIAPFNSAEDEDDPEVKWRCLDVGLANIELKQADSDVYADETRGAIFDAAHLGAHMNVGTYSASNANASTTLIIRQLPPYPFFLERDHFYSMLKDEELMERIRDTLAAFDVDSTFTYDPCCWTSVVYNGAKYANFKVKIFKVDAKDDLKVVEFQRRSGDCFTFKNMFRSFVNDLCRGQVVCSKDRTIQAAKPANEVRMRSFAPLPFKFSDDEQEEQCFTVQAATDSIKPLERMMNSEYCDIALEGVTAMAGVLCKPDETKDTVTYAQVDGLMESISKVAREGGGHISRCAAMCICACAEAAVKEQQAAVLQKIVDSSALEALVTLAQGGDFVLIETQRQALRGLVAMARSHAANIMAMGSQEMLANVEQCSNNDLRLGMHLSKLKEVFTALASGASSTQ
jgi:hypothetical protein